MKINHLETKNASSKQPVYSRLTRDKLNGIENITLIKFKDRKWANSA